jgi:hypothetical protein
MRKSLINKSSRGRGDNPNPVERRYIKTSLCFCNACSALSFVIAYSVKGSNVVSSQHMPSIWPYTLPVEVNRIGTLQLFARFFVPS